MRIVSSSSPEQKPRPRHARGAVCAGALVLAVLAALVRWSGTAQASGLVIAAAPTGQAGPQIDAAVVSPALRVSAAPAMLPRSYVVQRGDTLSGLAARFSTSVSALKDLNGLKNADRIDAGDVLEVGGGTLDAPTLPPDGPVTRVQFWPWPPAQGQTLAVWLQTQTAITPNLSLEGQTVPVFGGGGHTWAVIPIPVLDPPATHILTVTVGSALLTLAIPIQAGTFEMQEIPAETSDPILSEATKVNNELAQMTKLFAGQDPGDWTPRSRFDMPLSLDAGYVHTSPFGSRRTYGDGVVISAHLGEDLAVPAGTPVLAPAAATVVLAEPLFVRGNAVVLDHGNGVFTGYWHMEKIEVKVGDRVVAGQEMGLVGTTGLSTGAHLHWEMRIDGAAVDPLQWVESGK